MCISHTSIILSGSFRLVIMRQLHPFLSVTLVLWNDRPDCLHLLPGALGTGLPAPKEASVGH